MRARIQQLLKDAKPHMQASELRMRQAGERVRAMAMEWVEEQGLEQKAERTVAAVRLTIDRASGSDDLNEAQSRVAASERRFDVCRKLYATAATNHEHAQARLLACEKELSRALESSGGMRRPETIQETLRIAMEREGLEEQEQLAAAEKQRLAREEKDCWDEFTASLRHSYSKEQNYKEKVASLTMWASLFGFVAPMFLYEPFKLRKIEEAMGRIVEKTVALQGEEVTERLGTDRQKLLEEQRVLQVQADSNHQGLLQAQRTLASRQHDESRSVGQELTKMRHALANGLAETQASTRRMAAEDACVAQDVRTLTTIFVAAQVTTAALLICTLSSR